MTTPEQPDGRTFVSVGYPHMTRQPVVTLHDRDAPQPPLVTVDLGEFTVYVKSSDDARALTQAFTLAADLLDGHAAPEGGTP